MTILPIAYFPPISYVSLLSKGDVLLEAHENYQKQSWRNRCNILTANGVEALQVPVVHAGGTFRHPITEILVDYSRPWLHRHMKAIDSAYMSSAYFEYYRDGLYEVLDRHPSTLWELDMSVMDFILDAFSIPHPGYTGDFVGVVPDLSPKRTDPYYRQKPYFQVFSGKFGFIPNLSSIDLLFNEGPGAAELL